MSKLSDVQKNVLRFMAATPGRLLLRDRDGRDHWYFGCHPTRTIDVDPATARGLLRSGHIRKLWNGYTLDSYTLTDKGREALAE